MSLELVYARYRDHIRHTLGLMTEFLLVNCQFSLFEAKPGLVSSSDSVEPSQVLQALPSRKIAH